MATKEKIKSAQDTVTKAQTVLDAADKSLDAAEKAADAAEKAKSKKGVIISIALLLTIVGLIYLLNRDDS